MTDARETIWINKVYGQHPEDWNFTDGEHLTKRQLASKVRYRRADLPATDAQVLANERVKALVAVLQWLDRAGGLGLDRHERILAALEAIASPSIAAMKETE